jgi:hypothetical protein
MFPSALGNPPPRSFPFEQLYHEYSHWRSTYQPRFTASFNLQSFAAESESGSTALNVRKLVALQLEKEYYKERLVWALLIQEYDSKCYGNCYKRVDLASLAHYNL